jgi:adenine deaminase
MDMKSFLNGLPKAELHMHLEGALEPSLVRALAARNNLPTPASISSLDATSGYSFHDLTSFLKVYYPNLSVLLTEQDFHDLAYSYLTRAHAQNVVHTEMYAHTAGRYSALNQ